jgi:ribosomal protein L11 methylase PrmA
VPRFVSCAYPQCCVLAYRRAISNARQQRQAPGGQGATDGSRVHVLDLGAGTGLLSMMAVR